MRSVKERIRRIFKNSNAEKLLIFNTDLQDPNFLYLTGFKSGTFEYTPLVANKDSLLLLASVLEYGIAKQEHPKEMRVQLLDKENDMRKALGRELGGKSVAVNGSFIPYRLYNLLKELKPKPKKIIDESKAFILARVVKDTEEISKIKTAIKVTKKAIDVAKDSLTIGMSEKEVAAVIDTYFLKSGTSPAFKSIVSFDANSALPHHSPGNAKLKRNSIVLFDVGARYDNYCGDMTRTFLFKPDNKSEKYRRFNEIYGVVKKAQALALDSMKPGVKASKPHKIAAKYIDSYKSGKYKGKFIHSLGHSIGLEVHDGASFYPSSKLILKENMIFTDEPGIYIEGFGGVRIEDDVLINRNSASFI